MSHPVFSCFADENLKTALVTMSKHRVRRLPVLNKSGEGVLSIDDIVRARRRAGLFDVRPCHRSFIDRRWPRAVALYRPQPSPLNAWIRKRIFPGAYAPTLHDIFEHALEPHAFSVLDVENLRLHDARTLEHWRHRFNESAGQISAMFDGTFVRAWELYLAGSEAAFSTGWLQLFQVVFARGASNAVPWTRVSG